MQEEKTDTRELPVDWCTVQDKPHNPASMCNCNGRLDRLNAYLNDYWDDAFARNPIKFPIKTMGVQE